MAYDMLTGIDSHRADSKQRPNHRVLIRIYGRRLREPHLIGDGAIFPISVHVCLTYVSPAYSIDMYTSGMHNILVRVRTDN